MPNLRIVLGWFHTISLFGPPTKVGGLQYLTVGIVLAIIKYLGEASVIGFTTGKVYSPLDFINPFLSAREKYLSTGPEWLGMAWVMWTFPFLAACILMSVRRCIDAEISPWNSFLTLIPFLNIFGMLFLAAIPSSGDVIDEVNPYEANTIVSGNMIEHTGMSGWKAGLIGILFGAAYLVLTVVVCVQIVGSYGTALFFGAPLVTCASSAYALNLHRQVSIGTTIAHSILVLLFASLAFLSLGIEGAICIVMAMILFFPLAILGALTGRAIASPANRNRDRRTGMFGCMVALPVVAFVEHRLSTSPIIEVKSEISVNAPIEEVWNKVIAFPDIQSAPHGMLAWGIAYPLRAKIDGIGVGATRYCEFTTGTFVEPITDWQTPNRLAFDVTEQPEPMSELSPYHSIHPPHLDHSFRSVRGEFRLSEQRDGKTLLQGSTWYQIDIGPRIYWKLWTDHIIHRIHVRVLVHIRDECEHAQVK